MAKINKNELTPEEARVIINKGTERPFTGIYDKHFESGTYVCRQCDNPLYQSSDKFNSGCGPHQELVGNYCHCVKGYVWFKGNCEQCPAYSKYNCRLKECRCSRGYVYDA